MNGLRIFQDLLASAVAMGTPILFTALGEIITEKSGVQNLGLEGMMYIGAIIAFLSGLALTATGMPVLSAMILVIIFSAIAGAMIASLHAYVCLSLRANQIVSGLALAILGTGLSYYIGKVFITDPTSLVSQKLTASHIADGVNIPFVGEVLRAFLNQDFLVYLAYISVIVVWFFIYKTQKGLNLRAIGENPGAADAVGVNVKLSRYVYVMIGGAFAGVGGASLIISASSVGQWGQGMVAGRGWIAIALVIFARWNPKLVIWGAYLFGIAMALESRAQINGWFDNIFILKMIPYIVTILVLLVTFIFSKQKDIGEPESLSKPYDREER